MFLNKYSFTHQYVSLYAPRLPGVYQLHDFFGTVIYIGKSESSIQDRLLQHLNGTGDPIARKARAFSVEANRDPSGKESALLHAHQARYGRLPEGNSVMPVAGSRSITLADILLGKKK